MHLELLLHDPYDVSLLQRRGSAAEDRGAVRGQLEEVLLKVGSLVQDVDQRLAVHHQSSLLLLEEAGALKLVAETETTVVKILGEMLCYFHGKDFTFIPGWNNWLVQNNNFQELDWYFWKLS